MMSGDWLKMLHSSVPAAAVEQAFAALVEGAVLLDVRRPDETAVISLPGALECPRDALELGVEQRVAKGGPVYVICAAGNRSLLAAKALIEMGYAEVYSVIGGVAAWVDAGLPHDRATSVLDAERYARHLVMPAVGAKGQGALAESRVLIVGAGGLGSPAALYLTAAGVGTLGLVDDDTVELSNLQRQILHSEETVGWPKVASGAATLRGLNGSISIRPHHARVSIANVEDILSDYDIILDGSDNFETRAVVSRAARGLGLPYVYGSVYQFEGQVAVFGKDGPCYHCYQPRKPSGAAAPNCLEAGVLGVVPGVIGSLQALEAVKLILGVGDVLLGTLLHFDALSSRMNRIAIPTDPECTMPWH